MRISHREEVLLGYSRPSHDRNFSPKTPNRSSDIDFSDVFGGPPRRASFQVMQNGYDEDNDHDSWRGDGEDDEKMMGRSSWSNNPGGKPVFGDEIVSRKRYQSEDFFDDIFRARGDHSLSSSPRMGLGVRDPFSSTPGSRVLSPARPLPPGVEPLGYPAQFSLPARLSSSHSYSTSLSRLSGQAFQNHDVFQGGDSFSSYRQSPLSRKASSNGEEMKKDVKVDGTGADTQALNGGNQFHFSMHKWASKGLPLFMYLKKRNSLRLKDKSKLERSLSLNGSVELESNALVGEIQPEDVSADDCLSFNVHVVSAAGEKAEYDQIVDESVTSAPKLKPNSKVENRNSGDPVGSISWFLEGREDPALSGKCTSTETEVFKPDKYAESDLKPSSTKLPGVEGISGKEAAIPEVGGNRKHKLVKSKLAPTSDTDNVTSHDEVGKFRLKESSGFEGNSKRNSLNRQKNIGNDSAGEKVEENTRNDRTREKVKDVKGNDGATGKVKEFVKIFNQEPSSKQSQDVHGRRYGSSRWRNTDVSRAESNSTLSSTKIEKKMQGFDVNCRFDSSPKVNETNTPSVGKQFDAANIHKTCKSSSIKNEDLEPTMGRASGRNGDATYESILIEELPEILDKSAEGIDNHEDVQAYESRIRKWSKGKEGNIRALLSTLQYVLWPNCGWKPVPLVDIIEVNAVKRSYQRALLCLHPDKLQQKGAAFHQKFIAEKVFDILQEAWDHFNSLGSV